MARRSEGERAIAVLPLLALLPRPAHGYELKGQSRAIFGRLSSPNIGQLTSLLQRLERPGWSAPEVVQAGRPKQADL